MKFLMISKCGEGAHLLHKIMEEGNDVRICIQEQDYKDVWQGILTQTNIGSSWIDSDTIIVFDSSGMGGIADYFRKRGHYVFGGSSWADRLENDRAFGLNVMDKCCINHPTTTEFSRGDWESAEDFLEGNSEQKYVFKPSGRDLPTKL